MKIVGYLRGTKIKAGFTQIELILSMGILMILISVLTTLFGQILDVQLESKSTSSIDQNGRFIMARLTRDMQSAQSISIPATAGAQTNTLQIKVNSIDYIYSVSNSGNLVLTNNTGTNVLNSEAASVSGMTFKRVGTGTSNDTIQIGFTVSTRVRKVAGFEQKTFQTTLGLQ
jgi:Tfp pilus assembly protein PilW